MAPSADGRFTQLLKDREEMESNRNPERVLVAKDETRIEYILYSELFSREKHSLLNPGKRTAVPIMCVR